MLEMSKVNEIIYLSIFESVGGTWESCVLGYIWGLLFSLFSLFDI
jgi:hypothetical protein